VLYSLSIIGAKYAINIVHAKELVYSILMSSQGISPRIVHAVKTVSEYFTYEFSPDEIRWPYLFGGWWPQYKDGLESSLLWRTGDCVADAAYWACQERIKLKRELKLKPTLALGRKLDLVLNELPSKEEELISLIPLFGNKKTLKSYFGLLSRSPREVLDKYRTLYVKRQKKFYDYMKGREDMPSVTYGWIRRHPNSVIIPGMEGVKYSTKGSVVKPYIGLRAKGFDGWLSSMIQAGYILGKRPLQLSRSELKVHKLGVIQEFGHDLIPCSDKGVSTAVISKNVLGVIELFNKYGLFIERIDDEDVPLIHSEKWAYCPIPLTWIIRIHTITQELPDAPPLNESTAPFYIREVVGFHNGARTIEEEWGNEDVNEPIEPLESQERFESFLLGLLDSFKITEIRAKLV
jgi:hypothetical protein